MHTTLKELKTKSEIDKAIQGNKDKVVILSFLNPYDTVCFNHLNIVILIMINSFQNLRIS